MLSINTSFIVVYSMRGLRRVDNCFHDLDSRYPIRRVAISQLGQSSISCIDLKMELYHLKNRKNSLLTHVINAKGPHKQFYRHDFDLKSFKNSCIYSRRMNFYVRILHNTLCIVFYSEDL